MTRIDRGRALAVILLATGFLGGNAMAQQRPDLTVFDIKVNAQCQIEVTLKNLGPGQLPQTAFYVGTQPTLDLYRDGALAGGWSMGKRALQAPGGTYIYIVEAVNLRGSGTQTIRAVIDPNNLVTEADEHNSELSQQLSCTPTLPDLAIVKITFMKDCRAQMRLNNVGGAVYPDNLFNMVNLNRTIDCAAKGYMLLRDLDTHGRLKATGGEVVWTDLPAFLATSSITNRIAGGGLSAGTTRPTIS